MKNPKHKSDSLDHAYETLRLMRLFKAPEGALRHVEQRIQEMEARPTLLEGLQSVADALRPDQGEVENLNGDPVGLRNLVDYLITQAEDL